MIKLCTVEEPKIPRLPNGVDDPLGLLRHQMDVLVQPVIVEHEIVQDFVTAHETAVAPPLAPDGSWIEHKVVVKVREPAGEGAEALSALGEELGVHRLEEGVFGQIRPGLFLKEMA